MVPSYPGTAGYPPPPPPGYLVYPGAPAYPAYPGTAHAVDISPPTRGPPPPQLVRHTLHRRTWAWVVVVTAIVAALVGGLVGAMVGANTQQTIVQKYFPNRSVLVQATGHPGGSGQGGAGRRLHRQPVRRRWELRRG